MGAEDLTPLQLWSLALKQYRVMEECEATFRAAEASGDAESVSQAQRQEAHAIAEAIHAIRGLASKEVRQKLDEFHCQGESLGVRVSHGSALLNSFSCDFWGTCFVDLFYRGDCQERRAQHKQQLLGRAWIKLLLRRVDFRGWALCKEFAATVFNTLVRRAQMYAVHAYVEFNPHFALAADALQTISPREFVASALATGECFSMRAALKKKGLDVKVKQALLSMDIALRNVEGSDSQRNLFRFMFVAMRVWTGCSSFVLHNKPTRHQNSFIDCLPEYGACSDQEGGS